MGKNQPEELMSVSKTFWALVAKYIMTFVLAWLTFGMMLDNPLGTIAMVALLATVANYFVGDSLIYPAFGNIIAAIGDGLLAAAIFYLAAFVTPNFTVDVQSLVLYGVLVLLGEYFFHRYFAASEEVEP